MNEKWQSKVHREGQRCELTDLLCSHFRFITCQIECLRHIKILCFSLQPTWHHQSISTYSSQPWNRRTCNYGNHSHILSLSLSEWVTLRHSGLEWTIWFLMVFRMSNICPAEWFHPNCGVWILLGTEVERFVFTGVNNKISYGWIPFNCFSLWVHAAAQAHVISVTCITTAILIQKQDIFNINLNTIIKNIY